MTCEFNSDKCSVECKKYSICSYYNIQKQISEVQSQLNFIYSMLKEILNTNKTADIKLNTLESAVYKFLIKNDPDAYMKENNKESNNYEEEN